LSLEIQGLGTTCSQSPIFLLNHYNKQTLSFYQPVAPNPIKPVWNRILVLSSLREYPTCWRLYGKLTQLQLSRLWSSSIIDFGMLVVLSTQSPQQCT
jgi:hypothetical protein